MTRAEAAGANVARIGDVGISVQEKHSVGVPIWVGAGAIVAGVLLLVTSGRGSRA